MRPNVTIVVIILFFLSVSDSFAWYKRILKDGGPNGYLSTIKIVDNEGNTTIRCDNPGYSACPTVASIDENPSIPVGAQQTIYGIVTNKVKDNELSGSMQVVHEGVTYATFWEYGDVDGLNSVLSIKKVLE